MSRITLVFLAIFLILFGIFNVTNIQVEWGKPIMGFSALIAGVLCAFDAFRAYSASPAIILLMILLSGSSAIAGTPTAFMFRPEQDPIVKYDRTPIQSQPLIKTAQLTRTSYGVNANGDPITGRWTEVNGRWAKIDATGDVIAYENPPTIQQASFQPTVQQYAPSPVPASLVNSGQPFYCSSGACDCSSCSPSMCASGNCANGMYSSQAASAYPQASAYSPSYVGAYSPMSYDGGGCLGGSCANGSCSGGSCANGSCGGASRGLFGGLFRR